MPRSTARLNPGPLEPTSMVIPIESHHPRSRTRFKIATEKTIKATANPQRKAEAAACSGTNCPAISKGTTAASNSPLAKSSSRQRFHRRAIVAAASTPTRIQPTLPNAAGWSLAAARPGKACVNSAQQAGAKQNTANSNWAMTTACPTRRSTVGHWGSISPRATELRRSEIRTRVHSNVNSPNPIP